MKLERTPGIPGSPKLAHISNSVSPEQGRYYAQDVIARMLLPLKRLIMPVKPGVIVDEKSPDSVITAVLRANKAKTPPLGRVQPINPSELNNPQRVVRPVIRKAR